MRREFFQPDVVVVEQAILGVVDVNARCNVHRVAEDEAFLHAALANELFDGAGDVYKTAPVRKLEPEMFGQGFHEGRMASEADDDNSHNLVLVLVVVLVLVLVLDGSGIEDDDEDENEVAEWLRKICAGPFVTEQGLHASRGLTLVKPQ